MRACTCSIPTRRSSQSWVGRERSRSASEPGPTPMSVTPFDAAEPGWSRDSPAVLPRWLVMTGAALLVTGLAIAGMVAGVARVERLLPHSAPVRPELAIERVEFRPAEIIVHVRNTGAAAIQISQVAVDDGYRLFEHRGDGRLARLDATELRIPYPWIAGEPVHLSILAADGARFDHDVEAVALTPVPGGRSIAGYAAVGSFVG